MAKKQKQSGKPAEKNKFTPKQAKFIEEYLVDLNASAAARRAGYSLKTADRIGHENLKKPEIEVAIAARRAELARNTITPEQVLKRWWDIATADPNEIVHLRRLNCRHCYGKDHHYQWRDENEYARAVQAAMNAAGEGETPVIPSDAGGYGYERLLRPHAKCPYCHGEGIPEIHIEDTRDLEGRAKLLYAGIKQTAAGIEVKFRDQDKALENVAKHLGMFVERVEHSGNVTIEQALQELDGE